MPRPKTPRQINARPSVKEFRPGGPNPRETLILSLEEFEVIRLIDYEGMDQSQAAEAMRVSRQTVGRILKSARFTLSKAVVQGHGLRVEGGCYTLGRQGKGHRGLRKRHGQGCGRGRREDGEQPIGAKKP